MTESVDTVVIGAGVVGLAIARQLQLSGTDVLVLDKNGRIGAETSSRNSEVIHAGIYYEPGSLKAQLCVSGKQKLYAYCAAKGIPHARCGKLIVANAAQSDGLDELEARARANGVTELERLDTGQLQARETQVEATNALWSPTTGIVDSHALMLALQGDLEQAGGVVALNAEFMRGSAESNGLRLTVASGQDRSELIASTVINAGGLHAGTVARAFLGMDQPALPSLRYAKGSYFVYGGSSPFRHLIYPLPQEGGLGVHATLDLAGRVRFGPDVEWVDDIDYSFDPSRDAVFYEAVRRYWPGLPAGSLIPGYVGVRPKLHGPGEPPADFAIMAPIESSGARLVHLFGIESPGLTASLAIAEHVASLF